MRRKNCMNHLRTSSVLLELRQAGDGTGRLSTKQHLRVIVGSQLIASNSVWHTHQLNVIPGLPQYEHRRNQEAPHHSQMAFTMQRHPTYMDALLSTVTCGVAAPLDKIGK